MTYLTHPAYVMPAAKGATAVLFLFDRRQYLKGLTLLPFQANTHIMLQEEREEYMTDSIAQGTTASVTYSSALLLCFLPSHSFAYATKLQRSCNNYPGDVAIHNRVTPSGPWTSYIPLLFSSVPLSSSSSLVPSLVSYPPSAPLLHSPFLLFPPPTPVSAAAMRS